MAQGWRIKVRVWSRAGGATKCVVQGWRIGVRVWSRAGGSTKGVIQGWRIGVRVWSKVCVVKGWKLSKQVWTRAVVSGCGPGLDHWIVDVLQCRWIKLRVLFRAGVSD